MNYLICDDEPAAAESLKAKIAELEPDSSVRIFTTLQALLFNIEDIADRIDGVFMDIKLRNANGISGAARLLFSHPEIKLVYITGYASEYIQELYCVDSKALPAAILTKPIEMKYLRNGAQQDTRARKAGGAPPDKERRHGDIPQHCGDNLHRQRQAQADNQTPGRVRRNIRQAVGLPREAACQLRPVPQELHSESEPHKPHSELGEH